MEYILETNGLTKVYGQKEAARDVTLHVPAGKIYGLIAVLLGISARGGKGITSIVLGAIAIILAVTLTIGSVALLNKARETAASNPETPLLAKYLDNPNMGLIGMLVNIAKDGGDTTNLDALRKELDIVNNGTFDTAPAATEAPTAQPEAEPAG